MDLGGMGGGGGGSGDKATSSASTATSGQQFNAPGSGDGGGFTPLLAVALAGVLIFGFLGFLYIVKK